MNFRMFKKADGLWLEFTTKDKRVAFIKVESIAAERGPITRQILEDFCREVQPWDSTGKVLL